MINHTPSCSGGGTYTRMPVLLRFGYHGFSISYTTQPHPHPLAPGYNSPPPKKKVKILDPKSYHRSLKERIMAKHKLIHWVQKVLTLYTGNPYWKRISTFNPLVPSILDQLLLELKILSLVTKQADWMRRSAVLSLSLRLVFPAIYIAKRLPLARTRSTGRWLNCRPSRRGRRFSWCPGYKTFFLHHRWRGLIS